jgi:hypothetical protein
LKNNGDGTFQNKVDYQTGDFPFSVYGADLNGDSAVDLATANYYSDNVSVLINNGDGTFQTKVDYPVGSYPFSIFCADLDNDLDVDLIVANSRSDNVSLLLNQGDGTFGSKIDYSAGNFPVSVFCADLDNDSDLDLAVANYYWDSVSVLLNQTIVLEVKDEKFTELPKDYLLFQNYPNPFNQSTKIEFALSHSGLVSLNIYDILGRKVKTLVSENLSSGYKSVLWDGKDDFGNEVSSGIYFYQLKIGDRFIEMKKMVKVK